MSMLALEATLAEVVETLNARDIKVLLLKGLGTARWLYDRVEERPFNDIDLIVPPEDFQPALTALHTLGFRPAFDESRHHVSLRREVPFAVEVELHRTLYMLRAEFDSVWRWLSADAGVIDVGGTKVPVPCPAAAALIVVLHVIQHGVETVLPMRDLQHALQRVDLETWEGAAVVARGLRVQAEFAMGLRLQPKGRDIAQQLKLETTPAGRLARLRVATPPDTTMGIERLVAAQGTWTRARMVLSELAATPEFMRVWHPLARRGPVGLAAAYLYRPFWLAAKLPGGVRAWRRAAREPPATTAERR
jgi:hypothetical protein